MLPWEPPVAVEGSAKRVREIGKDISLVLRGSHPLFKADAPPVDAEALPERYLRYGYYYLLSAPTNTRVFVQSDASGVGRLVGVKTNGRAYPLRHLSYLVVRVRRPQGHVLVDYPQDKAAPSGDGSLAPDSTTWPTNETVTTATEDVAPPLPLQTPDGSLVMAEGATVHRRQLPVAMELDSRGVARSADGVAGRPAAAAAPRARPMGNGRRTANQATLVLRDQLSIAALTAR